MRVLYSERGDDVNKSHLNDQGAQKIHLCVFQRYKGKLLTFLGQYWPYFCRFETKRGTAVYTLPIRVSHIRTLLLRKQPASPALVAPASSHSSTWPTPPTPPPSSPTTDAPPQTFTGRGAQQVKKFALFIWKLHIYCQELDDDGFASSWGLCLPGCPGDEPEVACLEQPT